MAKFVGKQDIIREYSETVAGLLMTGWTIFTPTMGGSQGEDAHVDLINADHTVVARVLLYKDSDWGDGSDHKYVISVHSYVPEDIHAQSWDQVWDGGYCTIWNERGTELSKRVFYAMAQGGRRAKFHYTTDAAVPAQAKARCEYKWKAGLYQFKEHGWVPAQISTDRLVKFVRKHGGRGYGNTKAEEIQGVRKYWSEDGVRYVVDFRGAKKQLAWG